MKDCFCICFTSGMIHRDHFEGYKQLLNAVYTVCCYCSVAQSCLTHCNFMDCSTPGFPVLYCVISSFSLLKVQKCSGKNTGFEMKKIIIIQTLSSIIYHLCFSKTWVRSLNWDVQLTESQLIIPLLKVWSNWEMDTHIGHKCDIQYLPSQGSEKKAFNMQAIKSKTDQRPWMHRIFSSLRASQVVLVVKNLPVNVGDAREAGLIPGLRRCPEVGNDTPVFLLGKFHGQRSLAGFMESQRVGHNWSLEHWHWSPQDTAVSQVTSYCTYPNLQTQSMSRIVTNKLHPTFYNSPTLSSGIHS